MGNLFLLAGLLLALIYIYDNGGFGGEGFSF
jgi:hypothetical protein